MTTQEQLTEIIKLLREISAKLDQTNQLLNYVSSRGMP